MKTEEQLNDSVWLARFRGGEEVALKEVYELYGGSLFQYALKIIDNKEDAKDIVAEAFVRLWQNSESFERINNIKAYLYVVIRNACYSYNHSLKKKQTSHRELLYLSETKTESIEQELIFNQFIERIKKEIEKLPEVARKVFKMIFIEGLETEQVSKELGIEPVTVRSHKKRALDQLKMTLLDTSILSAIPLLIPMLS